MKQPLYNILNPVQSEAAIKACTVAQLLALLKKPFAGQRGTNQAYWAKCELRKRGYDIK